MPDKYFKVSQVSKTIAVIYLRVLTGELKGGLINMAKGEFIEIPDSSTIKIIL
jgi:hypothetical protein